MIDGLSGGDIDFGNGAVLGGANHVVHLHGVEDGDLLAAGDDVAGQRRDGGRVDEA